MSELQTLVLELESLAEAKDWEKLGAAQDRVQTLVKEACGEPGANVAELNQWVGRLQAVFQTAIEQLEREKNDSAQGMVQTRRQFNAAQSYLGNAKAKP